MYQIRTICQSGKEYICSSVNIESHTLMEKYFTQVISIVEIVIVNSDEQISVHTTLYLFIVQYFCSRTLFSIRLGISAARPTVK